MSGLRAVLRGYYGARNFGDDALLEACARVLRRAFRPDELGVLARETGYVRRLHPGLKVLPYDSREVRADLLVYGGGTQFFSFPAWKGSRAGSLLGRLAAGLRAPLALIDRVAGRPGWRFRRRAAFGVGLGPFVPGSSAERRARAEFGRLDYVSVRDARSLALCRAWGVAAPRLGGDPCFAPGLWDPPDRGAESPGGAAPGKRGSLGLIVRDWPHTPEGAAYQVPLLDAAARLRAEGFTVRFAVFCPPKDRGWLELLQRRGEECLIWDPERHSVASFLAELASFDCLVSARYHGAVFGAVMGKPVICVELEPKLALASQALSGGRLLWSPPFDSGECAGVVRKVFDSYRSWAGAAREAAAREGGAASVMAGEFLAFARLPAAGASRTAPRR